MRTLDRHGVDYVLIGGVAARLHGSPILTEDVDVTPKRSRDNLRRLAEALAGLNAKLAAPGAQGGLDVPLDAERFSSPVMKFVTQAGEIDVVLDPQGPAATKTCTVRPWTSRCSESVYKLQACRTSSRQKSSRTAPRTGPTSRPSANLPMSCVANVNWIATLKAPNSVSDIEDQRRRAPRARSALRPGPRCRRRRIRVREPPARRRIAQRVRSRVRSGLVPLRFSRESYWWPIVRGPHPGCSRRNTTIRASICTDV